VLDDFTVGRQPQLPTFLIEQPWQRAGKAPPLSKLSTSS
jgi:hypothetical protein